MLHTFFLSKDIVSCVSGKLQELHFCIFCLLKLILTKINSEFKVFCKVFYNLNFIYTLQRNNLILGESVNAVVVIKFILDL